MIHGVYKLHNHSILSRADVRFEVTAVCFEYKKDKTEGIQNNIEVLREGH